MSTREASRENPRSLGRALARHWRLCGMVFTAVILLTLWTVIAWPRMYQSQASLLVHFGGEASDNSASATTGTALEPAREEQVSALVAALNGDRVLGRVFESTGLDSPTGAAPGHEQAMRQLRTRVQIASSPGTNIIRVNCRGASPAVAQRLASRLVQICLDHGAQASADESAQGATLADDRQRRKSQAEAVAAQEAAQRERTAAAARDGRRRALEESLAKSDAELQGIRSERQAADERIAALEKQIDSLKPAPPASQPPPRDPASSEPAPDKTAQLRELEALERELAATRADDHPQLIAVRQQLADLRQALAGQPAVAAAGPTSPPLPSEAEPPDRAALVRELQGERSRAAILRGRETELAAAAATLRGGVSKLVEQATALAAREEEAQAAPNLVADDVAPVQQAVESEALADLRITGLSVLEPATLPTSPLGPLPGQMLALGLSLATTCGLGAALGAARRTLIVTTALDIEQMWDLPLVGVVPRLELTPSPAS